MKAKLEIRHRLKFRVLNSKKKAQTAWDQIFQHLRIPRFGVNQNTPEHQTIWTLRSGVIFEIDRLLSQHYSRVQLYTEDGPEIQTEYPITEKMKN